MKDIKLELEYMATEDLTPYENNAKIHTPEQIEQICASIRDFGMNDPIGIVGKDNIIVEGHGRLLACQKLGIKEVPVIRLDHLNEEQRKAYTLAHNKLTMNTGFDMDKLNAELQELVDMDMADYGFVELDETPVELDEDDYDPDEDTFPEPKAKLGDIYKLGNHRLMCGDSTSATDVAVNIACHVLAQQGGGPVEALCAIGDKEITFRIQDKGYMLMEYERVVDMARSYVESCGGFEKLAEWGLF